MVAEPKSCSSCRSGFSYCFWAKLIVAIPAIPIIAFLAASAFTAVWAQCIAGGAAVFIAVWAAVKIDRMAAFSGKVVKGK